MKYMLTESIQNVSEFKLHGSTLIYKSGNGIKEKYLFFNRKRIEISGVTGFQIVDGIVVFSTWSDGDFKIDLKTNNMEPVRTQLGKISEIRAENYLFFKKSEKTSVFNIDCDQVVDEIPSGLINLSTVVVEKMIVSQIENEVWAFALHGGKLIWRVDLSAFGMYKNILNKEHPQEVRFFIGIIKKRLIVQLSNASFLFVDVNNGSQIKLIQLNELFPLPSGNYYDDYIPAHLLGNHLIWLSNQRLLRVDLNSYEVHLIKDYFLDPRENQFRFMKNTIFEGKIYFVADYGWQYITPSYVGVMDATTGEVLWKQQLEKTGGLPNAPQVTKDKLYVLTANKVLHIFQKV